MNLVKDLKSIALSRAVNDMMGAIGALDGLEVYVTRFDTLPRWERNPASSKLLLVMEGRMTVMLHGTAGSTEHHLQPSQMLIIPQGTWHSPVAHGEVVAMTVADYTGTTTTDSFAETGLGA